VNKKTLYLKWEYNYVVTQLFTKFYNILKIVHQQQYRPSDSNKHVVIHLMWKVAKKILKIPKEQSEVVIKQTTQRETIIYKAVRRKLKIGLHELHYKPEVYSGASER